MKFRKILPLILCCLVLSGCWDKVEIDRRNFISTIAIDPGEDISKEKELKKLNLVEPFAAISVKKLNVTYGFPDMSTVGAEKSGSAEEKYISTQAYSMEDAYSEAMAKSSRDIYLGHTKLLILSSDILKHKDTVKEVVDYLQRNPNISRMIQVVVSDGSAEDYMKFKPETENSTQYYISGLMDNSNRNSRIMSMTLNDLLILLSENGNALLPMINLDNEKKEIVLSGAAIIKDYELKGQFTPLELLNIQLLSGKFKAGKKAIYMEGHPIDYIIDGYHRKMSVVEKGNKLIIDVDIDLEGQIGGYYIGKKLLDDGELEKVQKYFNNSISEDLQKDMELAIKEFDIDPFGAREYIEKFKPSLWKKIKKEWDKKYKDASVNVNVDTKIRRIGATQ
ncbi:Ger(x)C family spore germination protein [Clostridium lacusfryxellense]|uniref:Ger(x)C family spore germination protein n=1 Tax=Clostridium lacusfryxellense TaxID=205328 RepID=UPI001C0B80BF|nr:Ger(x)C family spore germination protein [Clostridium lacusfryxellense]MBU3111561.1 Ger(x)C family spore germination protein [Clostridium lacusfryxellense]